VPRRNKSAADGEGEGLWILKTKLAIPAHPKKRGGGTGLMGELLWGVGGVVGGGHRFAWEAVF